MAFVEHRLELHCVIQCTVLTYIESLRGMAWSYLIEPRLTQCTGLCNFGLPEPIRLEDNGELLSI